MIVGIGIDVVAVARLAAALDRTPGLAARLFTAGERGLPAASLAARFAAKEAAAKALGCPAGLRWTDAEVVRDPGGRPRLLTRGTVAAAAAALGVTRWHLSLSHDAGAATAVVLAETAPGDAVAGCGQATGGRGGAGAARGEEALCGTLIRSRRCGRPNGR